MQEQDKRNKGVRTKKKGDNWNSRNNKRDKKPARPKKHTPSKTHRKYKKK